MCCPCRVWRVLLVQDMLFYAIPNLIVPVVSHTNDFLDAMHIKYPNHFLAHLLQFVCFLLLGFVCPPISQQVWHDEAITSMLEVGNLVLPAKRGVWPAMQEENVWLVVFGLDVNVALCGAIGDTSRCADGGKCYISHCHDVLDSEQLGTVLEGATSSGDRTRIHGVIRAEL